VAVASLTAAVEADPAAVAVEAAVRTVVVVIGKASACRHRNFPAKLPSN
jgi:hypothetical protein